VSTDEATERSLAAQLHPDVYDEGFMAGSRSNAMYIEAESARTALEDENQKLRLDLACLEESTVDAKAYEVLHTEKERLSSALFSNLPAHEARRIVKNEQDDWGRIS
jgi:hypothetical protein